MKHIVTLLMLGASLSVAAQQTVPLTFERRSVVEEYTGTWCGNCPRGIVGLQRLSEDFGDRCICIAVHTGDHEPMVIPAYPDLVPESGGIPACTIDRTGKLDPYSGVGSRGIYHYGLDVAFDYRLSQPTEAGLKLTAQWNDAQQWDVRFNATTTFNIDSDTAPYRLCFVLLEDGLRGEGSDWQQVNYFTLEQGMSDSQNYADDDMKPWREAPYRVDGMEYNHVAVNTLGIKSGIAGSIQAPIVSGVAQHYSNLVTTLNVRIIQDKGRLTAVAMILNTETGEIVNAAKADIMPFGYNAISDATTDAAAQPSAVYDLQGRRVGYPAKGIYIKNNRKYIKH